MTHLQENIGNSLCRELAKELGVHDSCIVLCEDRIFFFNNGMQDRCFGYWLLQWDGNVPKIRSWDALANMLCAANRAADLIEAQLKKEGVS